MRKIALLMFLMIFVVAVTSGCSLIVKDEEVDAQTVIVEVAGLSITKAEVEEAADYILDYQEYLYSMYGLSFDREDSDVVEYAQESAIDALIEEAVLAQKVEENGLDELTDEELEEVTAAAEETYAGYVSTVETYYFSDTELEGDELDAAIDEMIVTLGYSTLDELIESETETLVDEKLEAFIVQDVTVSDDEIQEYYDAGVESAIEDYTDDITLYAEDVEYGYIVYYVPDGYRYVKNLLIMLTDEDTEAIEALEDEIDDDEDTLETIEEAIAELPEDSADDTEDEAKSREELVSQQEELTAAIEELTAELETATEAAYENIQATVDEVVEKLEAGEDFDELMAEYGEDTGMMSEPEMTTGYLVCEGCTLWVDEFTEASMALESIGDVSEPFRTDYGIHIVKYISDLESGEVPLEDISDEIEAEILADKQDEVYDETIEQWIDEADAVIYTKRLNN